MTEKVNYYIWVISKFCLRVQSESLPNIFHSLIRLVLLNAELVSWLQFGACLISSHKLNQLTLSLSSHFPFRHPSKNSIFCTTMTPHAWLLLN